jgi:hypothetical protein
MSAMVSTIRPRHLMASTYQNSWTVFTSWHKITTWVRYLRVAGRARMPQAGRPARRYRMTIARDVSMVRRAAHQATDAMLTKHVHIL